MRRKTIIMLGLTLAMNLTACDGSNEPVKSAFDNVSVQVYDTEIYEDSTEITQRDGSSTEESTYVDSQFDSESIELTLTAGEESELDKTLTELNIVTYDSESTSASYSNDETGSTQSNTEEATGHTAKQENIKRTEMGQENSTEDGTLDYSYSIVDKPNGVLKGTSITVNNSKENTLLLQYRVEDDGTVLFDSGKLKPGENATWYYSRDLESGNFEFDYYVIPWDEKGNSYKKAHTKIQLEIS